MSIDKLTEAAFELMLREGAINAEAKLGNEYEEPSGEIEFSQIHERKMKKLFKNEKRKASASKRRKLASVVACVLVVLFVGSGAAMLSVDAWRETVINYFFDKDKPNTDFNFKQSGGKTYSDDEIRLKYVPMGFEMSDTEYTQKTKWIMFSNEKYYFDISIYGLDGTISMDTENATVKKIVVNGYDAVYSSNKNVNALIWSDEFNVYLIMGNIQEKEILKVARGIQILKNKY